MLLVVAAGAEPPVRRERPDAGQVPVELGREEAGSAHLAVADDVDAGLLLVRESRGRRRRRASRRGRPARTRRARRRRSRPRTSRGRACDPTTLVRSGSSSTHPDRPLRTRTPGRDCRRTADWRIAASRPRASSIVAEPAEQPGQARRATVHRVVALPRGVHARARSGRRSVLDRPARGAWIVPFGPSPQRNDPSYSANAPVASELAVVAAVDDLVDVAQRRRAPGRRRRRPAARPARARRSRLAVGQDRARRSGDAPRPRPRRSAGRVRTGRPSLPATLTTPARMRGPADDRRRVVALVDARRRCRRRTGRRARRRDSRWLQCAGP